MQENAVIGSIYEYVSRPNLKTKHIMLGKFSYTVLIRVDKACRTTVYFMYD